LGPVAFLGAAPLLLQIPLIARWHEMAKWLLGLGCIAGAMALAYRAGGRLESAGAEHVEESALQQEIFLEALRSRVHPFSLTFFERWLHEWQADYALGTTVFLLFGEVGGAQLADVAKLIRSPLLRQPFRQLLELEPLANCSSGGCTRRMEEFFARATAQGGRGLLLVHKADECRTDDLLGDVVGGVERLMDAKGTLEVLVDGTPGQVKTSATAVLFLAPTLSQEKCTEILDAVSNARHSAVLTSSGMLQEQLELLWPSSGFSSEINTMKRAFINRLGSKIGVVCS